MATLSAQRARLLAAAAVVMVLAALVITDVGRGQDGVEEEDDGQHQSHSHHDWVISAKLDRGWVIVCPGVVGINPDIISKFVSLPMIRCIVLMMS